MLLKYVMVLAIAIAGCDTSDNCGGWQPDPQISGAPCESNSDCGDPGVCIVPLCIDGICAYDNAPDGMQCAQCDVYGVCLDGQCTSTLEVKP